MLFCIQMHWESPATSCSRTASARQNERENPLKEYTLNLGGLVVQEVKVVHDEDVSLLWATALNNRVVVARALQSMSIEITSVEVLQSKLICKSRSCRSWSPLYTAVCTCTGDVSCASRSACTPAVPTNQCFLRFNPFFASLYQKSYSLPMSCRTPFAAFLTVPTV